jgi:molybdopterin synthase sulfur carrier subunit
MEIQVLFFGVLADVAKTGFKHYKNVGSFGDLRLRVEDDFPEIIRYNYRIAVNKEIVSDEPVLQNGDEVAFIPPFTGG